MKKEIQNYIENFEFNKNKKLNYTKKERKKYIEKINKAIEKELRENEIKQIKSRQLANDIFVQ